MIPDFNNDPVKFMEFVKKNKDIFDTLLLSGKYNLTRNFNKEYVVEAYYFFRNFNSTDDANIGSLYENLDDFNSEDDDEQTDINDIVCEFIHWINTEKTREYFQKIIK